LGTDLASGVPEASLTHGRTAMEAGARLRQETLKWARVAQRACRSADA
jgi:hypothetical protein